jgi:hypothetical protein
LTFSGFTRSKSSHSVVFQCPMECNQSIKNYQLWLKKFKFFI